MRQKDIINGLKSVLASGGLGIDGAWPNISEDGEKPYFWVQHAAAVRSDSLLVAGTGGLLQTGRMSVTIVTEIGKGEDKANDYAEAVSDLFPKDLYISIPDARIRITGPCDIGGGFRDKSDWRVPVTVKYEVRPFVSD